MRTLLIVVLAVLFVLPVVAQDVPVCDTNQIAEDLTVQIATLEDDPVTALLNILQLAIEGVGDCTDQNYHFTSEEYGLSKVVGPIEMSKGVYIMTLTSPASLITVSPTTIGEEDYPCGYDLPGSAFFEMSGGASEGIEQAVKLDADCGVLWEFTSDAEWTFDIVKTG